MAENKKPIKNTLMADRRKQIEALYDGSDESLRNIFNRGVGSNIGNKYNQQHLKLILDQVGTRTMNRKDISSLTNYAYATDPIYSGIIDYLSNMFLWRYYYFPVQIKEKPSGEYKDIYGLMTEIVDGLVLEVSLPMILTKLFKEGIVFLYSVKNNSSKTVSTILLNPEYCKPLLISQYGTGVYSFDLKYFENLGFRSEELEQALDYFPSDLVKLYLEYKSGGPQIVVLDGRNSTYISTNEYGFPQYLTTLKGVFDYEQYRANEVEKSSAQLDRIMTHKIPSYEGRLLFEIPEVNALHKAMAKSLNANKRTRLITTFGDVEIHPLQGDSKIANETLEKSQSAIYRSAGLDPHQFIGDTQEALLASMTKDQAIVWKYVQLLMNFYNLTINNLYNFRGYQAELTMLPITHYNTKEVMEIYRRNGEYGIGRLEAIVASGTKQRHIEHKSKLENFLKLDEVLKPLASSHTQSSKDLEDDKKKKEENTDEDPSISPVESNKKSEPDDEMED